MSTTQNHLHNRAGYWVYRRRVPRAYQQFDTRNFVTETTGLKVADDPRANRAARVAERINAAMVAYWEGCAAGAQRAAKARLDEACRKARAMGVTYLDASELASTLSTDALLARVEQLERELAALRAPILQPGTIATTTAALTTTALLGGAKRVTLSLSKLLDEYKEFRAVSLKDKTAYKLAKWVDVHRHAVATYMAVLGDRDFSELTRDDLLDVQATLRQRILDGEIVTETANIDIGYMNTMYTELNQHYRWKLDPALFAGLRLKKGRNGDGNGATRPPFSIEWIRDRLLAPGAFAGLNPEARRAFYLMIETGLRPFEIVLLKAATIRLDAKVPFVQVADSKNNNSARKMPLVGVALAAMRLQPDGFPGYYDNPNKLSGDVNDYLTAADLREPREDGKETTLYSLRHAFKDRLLRTDKDLRDMLMGHAPDKEKYGDGFALDHKREALDKIAFTAYPAEL